jgi:hypothetical protein
MSDYAFFEYQAKLTNTGHAEDVGEPVHCMIRMKNVDRDGKRLHDMELHQQVGDNVLFVINPGPYRKISHSSIWNVTEEVCTNQERHRITVELGIARSISTTPNDASQDHLPAGSIWHLVLNHERLCDLFSYRLHWVRYGDCSFC